MQIGGNPVAAAEDRLYAHDRELCWYRFSSSYKPNRTADSPLFTQDMPKLGRSGCHHRRGPEYKGRTRTEEDTGGVGQL